MSNFDHPTERGFTDLLLRQRVWFKLCIWLWKWLWECRRKCHKDMPGKQSLEWGKHQLYRYWHITKFLFFAWGYDTWLTDKQRSKQQSTTKTKILKKSLHQNCENPLAKGFLTSTISSNDTEGVHIRTSIITSFCFSFLIIWFFYLSFGVSDILPPSFDVPCPASPLVAYAERDTFSAEVNWTVPTATDNSGLKPSIDSNFHPPRRFLQGNYVVTYSAVDQSGNKATCSFTIEVIGKI